MAKAEIACFEQFLLLSLYFQKTAAAEASESVYMWVRVQLPHLQTQFDYIVGKEEITQHNSFLYL